MLNLDPAKLLVIFVVALVVLGPERLPRAARQAAAIWRELTKIRDQVTEEVRSAIPDVDLPRIPRPRSAIAGFLGEMTAPTRSSGSATGTSPASDAEESVAADTPRRVPPRVVVHPILGDVAFLPDDPSMN